MRQRDLRALPQGRLDGQEIVISKGGRPIARLVPYRAMPQGVFGIDKGEIEILGNIIEPLDVEWEANR